jgi:hypothetical protein
MSMKYNLVFSSLGKFHTLQVSTNHGISCPGCLFESVQGFLKSTHMRLPPMYLKAPRFLYVYILLSDPIKENWFHILLMYPPPHH